MKLVNKERNCPSRGAPVVSGICAYCGIVTGLNSAQAEMEYPVLECKEATINFWKVCFSLIFAASFRIGAIFVLFMSMMGVGSAITQMIGLPFLTISAVASVLAFRIISHYIKVKNGTDIKAKVYGYMDGNVLTNGQPFQIMGLFVQMSEGQKFILYQIGNTLKLYGINNRIEVMVYQNYFMICKSGKYTP